MQMTYFN